MVGNQTIVANASDNLGIDRVTFYVDGAVIGTDTSSAGGWSIDWDSTGVGDGSHNLTARAYDTIDQDTLSAPVNVTVNNDDPPSVSITSPSGGTTVVGNQTIVASASDDNGVDRVTFYVDGTVIGTDTSSAGGWSINWNTATATSGSHNLTARAYDTANLSTLSAPVNVTVNHVPIADAGGPYSGTAGVLVAVNGSGSTDDGSIASYRWDWGDTTPDTVSVSPAAGHTYAANGTYTITLTVTDNDGATDTDTTTANISGNQSPVVSITAPTAGQTVLGTITVRVQATDAETAAGSLDVDVRIDSGTWQTATYNTFTQRYERALNTTTLTDGSHTVTARATDGFGNTTTTAPRSFTVNNNQAPTANAGGPYSGDRGGLRERQRVRIERSRRDHRYLPVELGRRHRRHYHNVRHGHPYVRLGRHLHDHSDRHRQRRSRLRS